MKVLIAEDNTVPRRVLQGTVESFGHECLVAQDGLEAWRIYQNTPDVDAIVSDWMMPKMDGLTLCREVRGLERPGYTFFVFLTALSSKENLLAGLEAGADEYLTKPLDPEQLRVKLVSASRVTDLHRHLEPERGDDPSRGPVVTRGNGRAAVSSPGPRWRGGNVWEILLAQEKIREEHVQQAIEAQEGDKRDLGQALLSLGHITEADLAQAQAQRLGIDYVVLDDVSVDPGSLAAVPERLLRKHEALPVRIEDGRLIVAMSDPTNVFALDDLRMASGHRILPVMVAEGDLQRHLNRAFSTEMQMAEMIESSAETEVEESDDLELGTEYDADEAPVVRLINSILQRAVSEEASDIHVEPQAREVAVRIRVDGVLRKLMSVPTNLRSGFLARLKVLANLNIAERRVPQDGRFSVRLGGRKVDLRVAILPTVHGEEAVLRLLDTSGMQGDLSTLGLTERDLERYREVFRKPYGTILVTGPTGSGKSTTLYSTLNELNAPVRKIITVEDPVEYRLAGINQVQVNPRAGLTFASGLRSILRNDPDVVMIGEIRDPETARTSVQAALTGHLVLATLHTNDAPGAVGRLNDMGVEPYLTASAIDCVVAQRLARRLCTNCAAPVEIGEEILSGMRFPFERLQGKEPAFQKAVGCNRCGDTGYRGRIGIYEFMMVTEEIREMVARHASSGEVANVAERDGMMRLKDDGLLKAARGLTTVEEVLRTVV